MTDYSDDNPEGNPWTFMSKQVVHDNPYIRHEQHQLLNMLGTPTEYTHIHFKNRAVGIVAYENDHVYLVGQYRYPLGQYSWELPEGGCPPEKDTLDAAKWELAEETGLRAEKFEPFLEMHPSNAITDEWAIVYLATGLIQGKAAPEDNEVLQTQRISVNELLKRVESGAITDAMTVAAAYKLAMLKAIGKLP